MPEGYSIAEAKTAIESLGTKISEFKTVNNQVLEAQKKDGEVSASLQEKLAKIEKELDGAQDIKDRLDKIETAAKRAPVVLDAKGNQIPESEIKYAKGLDGYLRKGVETSDLRDMEGKALAVQSDPDGGYYVTPDTSGRIIQRIFETSPLRSVAAVQVISTDALEGLIDDDEAGAEWVGETQLTDNEKTPKVGAWRIPAHEMATRPKATMRILEDAAISIEQWLASKVADKFSRTENEAFVNGDGNKRPRGFLTYPAAADPEVWERNAIGRVVTAGVGTIDFDDIFDMFYTMKNSYRAVSTWALNRRTIGTIRKLKDGESRYLWEDSLQVGTPATILGRPMIEFEDMPDVADGTLPIALADWSLAYQIVDRLGIATLRDPYTIKPYVEFYTRKRVGGDVLNWDAIKLLEVQA